MLTLDEASRFHGHLGPFLMLGFEAGSLGRRLVDAVDSRELEALVMVPLKTPFSCIIDGVQCSTGCTLGKLNIKAINSRKFEVIVKNRRNGKVVVIKIKHSIIDKLRSLRDMRKAVEFLKSLKLEEVFEVKAKGIRVETRQLISEKLK